MRNDYISNYLAHHGVLGQKWGIRRFQNPDGSLTAEGIKRYKRDNVLNNIGRAVTNSSLGQRLAVNLNKGYRQDKKEIKGLYKQKKAELKEKGADKEQLKSLKSDYKKTKGEARTTAAKVNYSWQSDKANEKIQTQSIGKGILKDVLMGGFGSKVYEEVYQNTGSRGAAVIDGLLVNAANVYLGAIPEVAEYAYRKSKSQK